MEELNRKEKFIVWLLIILFVPIILVSCIPLSIFYLFVYIISRCIGVDIKEIEEKLDSEGD